MTRLFIGQTRREKSNRLHQIPCNPPRDPKTFEHARVYLISATLRVTSSRVSRFRTISHLEFIVGFPGQEISLQVHHHICIYDIIEYYIPLASVRSIFHLMDRCPRTVSRGSSDSLDGDKKHVR